MPRTAMAVSDIVRTGTGLTKPAELTVDVANGNSIPNDGRVFMEVRNSNGAAVARVLTVVVKGGVDGSAPAAKTYSIPAAGTRLIGPFDTTNYGTSLDINGDNTELKVIPLRLS